MRKEKNSQFTNLKNVGLLVIDVVSIRHSIILLFSDNEFSYSLAKIEEGMCRSWPSPMFSLLLLCTCASLFIIILVVDHYTFGSFSLHHTHSSSWLLLSITCLVLIIFFLFIVLFNRFVGLIQSSFATLLWHLG
jgi:hypothetical protein